MRNLVTEAFSLHLFVLRCFGLMPIENHEKLFRIHSLTIYCLIIVPFPTLSLIYYFTGEIDINQFTESAFLSLELATFIFKFWPFVRNGPTILATIKILERPMFSNSYKERQKHILDNCNKICQRCAWYFLMNVFLSAPIYSTLPLITKSNTTPTEIWLPFDYSKGTKLFMYVYIYCCVGTWVDALCTAAYDTLVAGLVYQGTAQIRILKDNLLNLKEDAEEEIARFYSNCKNKEELLHEIVYNNIKKCIVHHQHILKFIETYEKYFANGVFAQFLGGCLVVCVSIFQLTIVKPFTFAFFFAVIYTISVFFELFLYCYFGTTLRDESFRINTAIYMGKWYEYSLKSKKLLLILMEKANKPLMVTAGAVLDLSLDTFSMIIRRAYSFYAVLSRYQ